MTATSIIFYKTKEFDVDALIASVLQSMRVAGRKSRSIFGPSVSAAYHFGLIEQEACSMADPIQVFLSYVQEDEQQVHLLYRKLSETGYSPWMERENIVAGETRELSVRRAIRRSDFFLVCLSTNSVSKRGGVQKGIKDALDIRREKLEDDIYIIPVRLDECEVPESLAELQWVDWFEERGWERLRKALEIGAARRAEERDAEAISKAVPPPVPAATDATRGIMAARGPAHTSTSSASSPGPVRNRWALLVGINRYVDPAFSTLNFCVNDVLGLERVLKDLGYTVVTLHDDAAEERLHPTRENIEAELKALCEAAGEDDLVLAHFACHGKLVDGKGLLVTREVRNATLPTRALPVAEVEKQMLSSRASRLVLLLDACHVGANIGRDLSDPEFIRNVYDLAQGYALIAASTAQQVAQEWQEKQYGVFTYYLLEALSDQSSHGAKGFVTVDDIKNYVTDKLRRWSIEQGGLIQAPTARTEGCGDIILADYRELIRPAAWVVRIANPFGSTHPVNDHLGLFGRESELRFIFDELSKHNNVSLVGKPQIGNSSLLLVVKKIGPERMQGLVEPAPAFVYLDLARLRNERQFYQALCTELGLSPCTGHDLDEALRGKRYVLCLDEIQRITGRGFAKELHGYLRASANGAGENQPFKLVIASREPLGEIFPDKKYGSSLAHICASWDVRPFTPAAARKYLSEKLKDTTVVFSEAEIDDLVKESEGYPGKLRRLASRLFDQYQRRGQS